MTRTRQETVHWTTSSGHWDGDGYCGKWIGGRDDVQRHGRLLGFVASEQGVVAVVEEAGSVLLVPHDDIKFSPS